ncbi:UDP-glucoronosyl and UDP-glucosyl transferase family protein [Aphelenchoides avenae]|nr:UDP-glucoronosyl and UDP-glucosyl transferase family protein [Aphelenchus avenae]
MNGHLSITSHYRTFVAICLLAVITPHVGAHKYLVYNPRFGKSHVLFMGKLADLLAEAGHEVVVYQPIMTTDFNITGSRLPRIVTRDCDVEVPDIESMREQLWDKNYGSFSQMRNMTNKMGKMMASNCDNQLADSELMGKLAAEKFDLALAEPFDACSYAVFERVKVTKHITVLAGSMMMGEALGLPSTPSFVPGGMTAAGPNMNYWQRVKNTFGLGAMYFMWKYMLAPIEEISTKRLGTNYDTFEKLADSSYVFVNAEEHLEYTRPITHKIVYIGGIGVPKKQPLDEALSFGTVGASHAMPADLKKIFLESFAQFPDVTFLWKYEKPEHRVADGYPNVIAEPWLPQPDLLGHPKLLAFVTHAGANSISEAVYSGVPLVCIPLFGDQNRNAKLAEYRNVARTVTKDQLSVEALTKALREVLYENPSIRQSAQAIARMIAKKPMSPVERFIKHTEFATEFNVADNLDMYGRHLNAFQYYSLDVILPLLSALTLSLYQDES